MRGPLQGENCQCREAGARVIIADQTLLVSRQGWEANAKNQPMFRKRLFKDILIAISGSFRTDTSNAAGCVMSPVRCSTMGELREEGAAKNTNKDGFLSLEWHTQRRINARQHFNCV